MKIAKKIINILKSYVLKQKNTKLVVLGHHKTGTTAIASLLAHSANLSISGDPIYEMSPSSSSLLDMLLNDTESFVRIAKANPRFFFQQVVKEPDYILSVDGILKLYPYSKFVFIIRKPHQIIRSIFNRLSIDGTTDLHSISRKNLSNSTPNWEYIVNGDPKVDDNMTVVERLAWRIEKATLAYLEHRDNIQLIKYEDFIEHKSQYIEGILNKIDIPCLQSITSIEDKQFQPKGDHKVLIDDFFGRKNYDLITKICSKTISSFEY
tara:strand:+ start:1169 stop:1963 length:795 start_codon:yes stop_codon:yes gene_type:complete